MKALDVQPDGLVWRKSSYSGGNGECVEVACDLDGCVQVRDSKDAAGPALVFDPDSWRGFVSALSDGRFQAS